MPDRRRGRRIGPKSPRPARSISRKLDPRLAFLLSLSPERLVRLRAQEVEQRKAVIAELNATVARLDDEQDERARAAALVAVQRLERQLSGPITTGVRPPPRAARKRSREEATLSAFILSDASAADLTGLGVTVHVQAGDIFTASFPRSAIPRLLATPAVRFIELARPLYPNLDVAVPYTQLDTLHASLAGAGNAIKGQGVIVGVTDVGMLDVYHPAFRTAARATRVLSIWDQTLTPVAGEAPPAGWTYGVEYDQTAITNELASVVPYQVVRHGAPRAGEVSHWRPHGTRVTGIAAGNGLDAGGNETGRTGAAPEADIIFVRSAEVYPDPADPLKETQPLADSVHAANAFSYIFQRAGDRGQACVVNMSNTDDQGPHDGRTLGEQFLDTLLLTPGRAITISAGNSNNQGSHATGVVAEAGTTNLVLRYLAGASNSDDFEIWYDGHDRFRVTVTAPTGVAMGPVDPPVGAGGLVASANVGNGVLVHLTSVVDDPRNHDNVISVVITVPAGQSIPAGDWTIALHGLQVINGRFHAWVDRNNRNEADWLRPHLDEDHFTIGVPATARHVIAVGNHNKAGPPPVIDRLSGRGPTRDGRVKPDVATVGTAVSAPVIRSVAAPSDAYDTYFNSAATSWAAPLVAGACALLFQCRGGGATWANLKQILQDAALAATPQEGFGFGAMQVAAACTGPMPTIDVWLRDALTDVGVEPFTGGVAWLSPDIEILDTLGNPVANPTYHPFNRYNNIVRVTVRNRGGQPARNVEVRLYWADPATNIPASAWQRARIYTGLNFADEDNTQVVAVLDPNATAQLDFAWAPPPPSSSLAGDSHFCLIAIVESEGDRAQIGAGGWAIITARNNVALRNVWVAGPGAAMGFYMVGSSGQDSLIISPVLAEGQVELLIPVEALPWRDLRLIQRYGARPVYGLDPSIDPLREAKMTLKGGTIRERTDVLGAEVLRVHDGMGRIVSATRRRLILERVRLAPGARMPVSLRLRAAAIDAERHCVHVAQFSDGQLVGGVTLELRR